jgi:two-component system sensor histidine kinase UhpB
MTATRTIGAPPPAVDEVSTPALQGWSLYRQVLLINTGILVSATVLLVASPATVSFPVVAEQGLLIAISVAVIVLANAAVLRLSFQGLSGLVRQMEALDVLRARDRIPVRGGKETRALIVGYNRMLDGLAIERRASTRRSVSALEGERRRIGQELHDEIGQRLTGILLQLSRVRDDAPDEVQHRLHEIQAEVRDTLDEIGTLAWQLRPGILDDLGLPRALQALGDALREHATADIVVDVPARTAPMTAEVELAVYRIAQEALTNAVRHAVAGTIHLSLSVDGRHLRLEIVDDGRGLPPDVVESAGIRGMRERALLVNGRLEIGTGHGGTGRARNGPAAHTGRIGRGVRVALDVDDPDRPCAS